MPTITLSKKALQDACTKKRNDEDLKERISLLGTDLERLEKDEIDVEIFPNRPDLLSQQGFNRAFASFVGDKPGLRTYKAKKATKDHEVVVEKAVEKVRPYTACAVVKGLHLKDREIKDVIRIQEKLHVTYGRNRKRCAIGIYPLEDITLPITYTAKKPDEIRFTPLEAKKEMTGNQILSQHPTGREYGHLLEGLDAYPVFLDATGKVLSMPPIINSEETGRITTRTRDVFIECSGHAWHVVHGALSIIATALADMGGAIEEMTLDYPKTLGGARQSPQLQAREMPFNISYINKYLGMGLTKKDVKALLERMGLGYKDSTKGSVALIPPYRVDMLHPIDLVEDVAIAYGTDKVEGEVPNVATVAEEQPLERFQDKLQQVIVGHGLVEVKNYNLSSKETQGRKVNRPENVVQVAQAASQEYDTLRTNLLSSGLLTLQRNKHHEYPQHLFERGDVFFHDDKTETKVREEKHLSVVMCSEDADYTKARQVLDSLGLALDVKLTVEPVQDELFIEGRAGVIKAGKKPIGVIGEVNPDVLENFLLEMPVAAFEVDVEKLYDALPKGMKI
ncbi:MAG: phenylalanine--tRNA ligase subunit beta [Candidatus Woesearchaeota archaeon]